MRNENGYEQDDEVLWGALLSSIIALITTALVVLQQVGKKAGGKMCQANFDFTGVIGKLSQLSCNNNKCCVCKRSLRGDDKAQQFEREFVQTNTYSQAQSAPQRSQRESQTDVSGFIPPPRGKEPDTCELTCAALQAKEQQDYTYDVMQKAPPVPKSYGKRAKTPDPLGIIPYETLTTEELRHTDTQTPVRDTFARGVQYERTYNSDKGNNTDGIPTQNQFTYTDTVDRRQVEVQSKPSTRAVCTQPSCPNNNNIGTQKTMLFEEPPNVQCEVIETLSVGPADFYHRNGQYEGNTEMYEDTDDEDEDGYNGYEETFTEDATMYTTARGPYRPETHCIRPTTMAKSCPDSCSSAANAIRRQIVTPQYAQNPSYAKKYKPQGLPESMRSKARPPPVPPYAYRRQVPYTTSNGSGVGSGYSSRTISKVSCPYADPKNKKLFKGEIADDFDKCSCTNSMSSNV